MRRRLPTGRSAVLVLAALAVVWGARQRVEPPGPAPIEARDPSGVVVQRHSNDCGVAAAGMLIRALGGSVDLDELWRAAEIPPAGLGLHEIAALTARWDVPTVPFASPVREYTRVPTPWIAHLAWRHYVVVESTAGARVVVADPRGRRDAYSPAAFMRAWSGYGVRGAPDRR